MYGIFTYMDVGKYASPTDPIGTCPKSIETFPTLQLSDHQKNSRSRNLLCLNMPNLGAVDMVDFLLAGWITQGGVQKIHPLEKCRYFSGNDQPTKIILGILCKKNR